MLRKQASKLSATFEKTQYYRPGAIGEIRSLLNRYGRLDHKIRSGRWMNSETIRSVNNVPIRLTDERWHHITKRHPELVPDRNRAIRTVEGPDFVAKGLHGELKAARLFTDLPLGARYLMVYRETAQKDGFIITARISSEVGNIIKGGVVWRRN